MAENKESGHEMVRCVIIVVVFIWGGLERERERESESNAQTLADSTYIRLFLFYRAITVTISVSALIPLSWRRYTFFNFFFFKYLNSNYEKNLLL